MLGKNKLCKFLSDGIEILSTAEHSRSAKDREEQRMEMWAPQPPWFRTATPSPGAWPANGWAVHLGERGVIRPPVPPAAPPPPQQCASSQPFEAVGGRLTPGCLSVFTDTVVN